MRVTGFDQIPSDGPYIFCPNHSSYWDGFWFYFSLPRQTRKNVCYFSILKNFESSTIFTRWIVKALQAIPIDADPRAALQLGQKMLKDGRSLVIFPEGTRTRSGELGKFFRGSAQFAISTDSPIIPVRIIGAYAVWPPHRSRPKMFDWRHGRRFKIDIRFGAPIYPSAVQQMPLDAALTELTEQLRAAVIALGKEEK